MSPFPDQTAIELLLSELRTIKELMMNEFKHVNRRLDELEIRLKRLE